MSAQTYSLDNKTLAIIEIAVVGVLEAFRYGNWQKTGTSGLGPIAPFDPMGMASEETKVCVCGLTTRPWHAAWCLALHLVPACWPHGMAR